MDKKIAIVGGCGHVGLPLGISFALLPGHHVDLIDTNENVVQSVREGKLNFVERGGEAALKKVVGKSLFTHTNGECISSADCVVFVTGTLVDEHLNPRIHDVLKVLNEYLPYMQAEQLVILRSTVYPGVTQIVREHLDNKLVNIDLAFCPERVAQGFAIEEIKKLPQIVSAFDRRSEDRAAELFGKLTEEIIRLTPIEAELAKLFSNSWRYLEFAVANQHYMIAESSGANFQRIHKALTHNYPRAASYKTAGLAAGPCLFKDTMQLSAFYKSNYFLGHSAMLINEGFPNFLVEQLEKKIGSLRNKKIGLLGMSFKANNDDIRESLSYKIKKILESKLANVSHTDVFQKTHQRLSEILKESDAFILGAPHREYQALDLQGKPFIDCWGFWSKDPDIFQSQIIPEKIAA